MHAGRNSAITSGSRIAQGGTWLGTCGDTVRICGGVAGVCLETEWGYHDV